MDLSRRTFLGLSGLTVGSIGRLNWNGSMPRVAILGLGVAGQQHALTLLMTGCARLSACCDTADARLKSLSKKVAQGTGEGVRCYPNAKDLLESERPDWVVVATPDNLHTENVLQAVKTGAKVLVEAPAVHTWEDLRELEAMDRQMPGQIRVIARWRESAPLVAQETPVSDISGEYSVAASWQQQWELGNGVLGTLGYGLYDAALGAARLGLPKNVFATGDHAIRSGRAPNHVLVMSRHGGGQQVTWLQSPHLASGVSGISVKDAAGRGIYQMTASEVEKQWHSPAALPLMWQHLILGAEGGGEIAVPLPALAECHRAWLAAKTALVAGRALDFSWSQEGFPV